SLRTDPSGLLLIDASSLDSAATSSSKSFRVFVFNIIDHLPWIAESPLASAASSPAPPDSDPAPDTASILLFNHLAQIFLVQLVEPFALFHRTRSRHIHLRTALLAIN